MKLDAYQVGDIFESVRSGLYLGLVGYGEKGILIDFDENNFYFEFAKARITIYKGNMDLVKFVRRPMNYNKFWLKFNENQ